MEVSERIAQANRALTPAERRVAEVVLDRPQLVAFGTVAELAEQSGAGAATVVRLATKLGFDGFSALQSSVQRGLARQLRPAYERIREPGAGDHIEHHLQLEVENVRSTLGSLDAALVDECGSHLADLGGRVWIISGDASLGVCRQLMQDLHTLRDGIQLIDGNPVAVARMLSMVEAADAVVIVDVRRYDRWVVEAAETLRDSDAWTVAITDRLLSPLASLATRTVVVSAAGGGPFDSHVGTLALFNVMVATAADRLRAVAAERLDRAEAAWGAKDALLDR